MKINKNLLKLTDGERLWIIRRRQGLAQDAVARAAGLGEKTYAAFETGAVGVPDALLGSDNARRLWHPTPPEKLALARRRAGKGLAAVAQAVKVSRVTLLAMERRADPALRHFWERCGFRF
jgi:DNA-binding XRE family transcriptional regulator